MQARRDDYITQPFVLDAENLQKLADAFANSIGTATISVRCADKIDRDFSSVTETLTFENAPARCILSLTLRARSESWRDGASLRFGGDSNRNISVNLQGDEDTVLALNETIADRLSAMRPWYWRAARTDTFFLLWLVFLFVFFGPPLFSRHILNRGTSWGVGAGETAALMLLFSVVLSVGLSYIAGTVDRLKRVVFPMAVFAIGQGEKRYSDMDTIRSVVVVSLIISLIGSILTSFLP